MASPSSKLSQELGLLEYPLIRHITESKPYSEDELKQYVVQAIKQGAITFRTVNDEIEETPDITKFALKGCREILSIPTTRKQSLKSWRTG